MPKLNLREVDALLDEDREEPEHEDLLDDGNSNFHYLLAEDELERRYQEELKRQEEEYWEEIDRANAEFLYDNPYLYDD